MPPLKRYRVFISHAWDYGEEYQRIVNLLDAAPRFWWENYSVPEDSPIHNARSRRAIRDGLSRHIRPTHIIIILAGMYAAYSDWMQTEIDLAHGMNKPVLGVVPWGGQKTPRAVQEASDEIVGWSTSSIVSAIRRLSI